MSIIDKIRNKFNEMFPDESDPKPVIKDTMSVIMPDGRVKEYSGWDHLDKNETLVCFCTYHWHCDCRNLEGDINLGGKVYLMSRWDAERANKTCCYQCLEYDKEDEE